MESENVLFRILGRYAKTFKKYQSCLGTAVKNRLKSKYTSRASIHPNNHTRSASLGKSIEKDNLYKKRVGL